MLEPESTNLTIFLGKEWNHASTVLRSSEKDNRVRNKFTVVGLPPRVDEKSMRMLMDLDEVHFTSLSIQQPSDNLLELMQKEKPSVVVDVSTQQTEKTLSGTYLHGDYNTLTLQQEDGTMLQIPRMTIRFMRVVYANNKPAPQMLQALSVHLSVSSNTTARYLVNHHARLDYFFNGLSARVVHVFEVDATLKKIEVRSYLHLTMMEPSYQLENVKIRLVEDYREKVDSSRQPAYEEEAYQTYSAAPPQASPAVRKQTRVAVPSKSSAYANQEYGQQSVQQGMQQAIDVTSDTNRVLLEKGREHVFAIRLFTELESGKVIFRLEKSAFAFLLMQGFREDIQPLDARIAWDKKEESDVILFSGEAHFFADNNPLGTESVAFSPWKLGSEMTIDFPLSGFAFGRRLLHSTFDNQEGGRTKKVFRVDIYISKHETLKPKSIYFESLENIGDQAKQVKFILGVFNGNVTYVQFHLDEANKIDPYAFEQTDNLYSTTRGSIKPYMNPDTGFYEPGVYKLEAEANNLMTDRYAIGTMSHFFYEVLY